MFTTVSETTLQESAAPKMTTTTLNPEDSRLVLGNRQIAAALFMVLALVTVIATLAYIAGRATPGAGSAPVSATAVSAQSKAPEQVIVVDAKTAQQQAASAPVAVPAGPDDPPAPGTLFFQVASVDKGMADVSVQYLIDKGFPARRAPGASAAVYRVLVGPLGSATQMSGIESQLKDLGFSPFPKKY